MEMAQGSHLLFFTDSATCTVWGENLLWDGIVVPSSACKYVERCWVHKVGMYVRGEAL